MVSAHCFSSYDLRRRFGMMNTMKLLLLVTLLLGTGAACEHGYNQSPAILPSQVAQPSAQVPLKPGDTVSLKLERPDPPPWGKDWVLMLCTTCRQKGREDWRARELHAIDVGTTVRILDPALDVWVTNRYAACSKAIVLEGPARDHVGYFAHACCVR